MAIISTGIVNWAQLVFFLRIATIPRLAAKIYIQQDEWIRLFQSVLRTDVEHCSHKCRHVRTNPPRLKKLRGISAERLNAWLMISRKNHD